MGQYCSIFSCVQECLKAMLSKFTRHLALPSGSSRQRMALKVNLVVISYHGQLGSGKSASVQIFSGAEVDSNTEKGKLSERAYLKHGRSSNCHGKHIMTYLIQVQVDSQFGIPGAILVKNQHKHEFFLQSASIDTPHNQIIHFDCNSWVYPFDKTKSDRLFFSNLCYLPDQTPTALVQLRNEELASLRGNGMGERKEWDRIYDYDYYNDLGNPDKGQEHARPVLGGSKTFPYPRRGRTGHLPCNTDPLTESRPQAIDLDIYVPSDERCSPNKLKELISNSIQAAIHFLIPEAISMFQGSRSSFDSFEELHGIFSSSQNNKLGGWVRETLKKMFKDDLFKEIIAASNQSPIKLPLPQIIAENELAWRDDEEFARQMLAGTHPVRIRCLETFPPQSKNGVNSSIKPADIEQNLEGFTLSQALELKAIFILDHHDYLIPYLDRINANGVCVYASRTLLFLRSDGMLKPIAIELSLPSYPIGNEIQRVFLPATEIMDAAMWQLAKAHVMANDTVYHHLVSHWLLTHAVVEPFIIATKRQLSVMHPIHRLLRPHFKDTMHINALSRTLLINAGGILEKTLFSRELSMQLSSELYKDWRFDEQGLPADLLKRHMAIKDTDLDNPTGIQVLLLDYPYATDGLEIWVTIKAWVKDFCSFFYQDDDSVKSDAELQAWWSEIRNVGHGDKCDMEWWYEMKTLPELIEALTTLIWIASAMHSSVTFGQFAYYGYPPNRPALCRKFIPEEGTFEYAEFLEDPDKFFLHMLPERFEMCLGVALAEVLSHHMSDEVYLGRQPSSEWIDNVDVKRRFAHFSEELEVIEKRILERNRDPSLKNRQGPANIPYTLLYPSTSSYGSHGGITGKGIPNSISI